MSGGTSKVRTQNLRDFTVQIRRISDDAIVGTGIIVSIDGKIVTCAHVVKATGIDLHDADGAELGVYFPELRGRKCESRTAKVSACFSQHDDDLVLLQLIDSPPPRERDQIAVLGFADISAGHEFRSYGYRSLDGYNAGRAEGKILGDVEPPEGCKLLVDPVQLKSGDLNLGMSGAAVLDVDPDRNLVVGIISEVYFPDNSTKDRDTAWAVNARVLTFDPANLPVQYEPYPMRSAYRPKIEVEAVHTPVILSLDKFQEYAPASLKEWVGREELLKAISSDWSDPDCRLTELIGFGGEGKSSLARRWLDDLLEDSSQTKPDGIFWWGFYERRNTDEFFEAALEYLSGGGIDPAQYPSSNAKAHLIAAILCRGHYVFVLDGLEVLQHEDGDSYGMLKSADLREFLSYFANPEHSSFCLITSRAPILDLIDYTTHNHRDVERLSPKDGRDLLLKLGVKGSDEALNNVVTDWSGHALTLSLFASYLVEIYEGDVSYISKIPPPTADEPRYERVTRILRRYDEHLNESERTFLMIFSAFRVPVDELAFELVFLAKQEVLDHLTGRKTDVSIDSEDAFNEPIIALSKLEFNSIVKRLVRCNILQYNPHEDHYIIHPLIRAHYYLQLEERSNAHMVHKRIKEYYLAVTGEILPNRSLDDLKLLIEALHHACQAGHYDEAFDIYLKMIQQHHEFVLTHRLGAWAEDLALMREFFHDGELSNDPLVKNSSSKSTILNEIGLCLVYLGDLSEAASFYERAIKIALYTKDWSSASISYQNLSELHCHLGDLDASAQAARQALKMAKFHVLRSGDKVEMRSSLAGLGWVSHLKGDSVVASALFQQAEELQRKSDRDNNQYLYCLRGIQHADYLRHTCKADYARRITNANLEICKHGHVPGDFSRSHRVLGDLDAEAGNNIGASNHYDKSLKIAYSITKWDVLIEALLARGRWAARRGEADAASSDLEEALDYALLGEYRIYEVDIRVGLAWMHLAEGNNSKAREQAESAKSMSASMGYHWGQMDAKDVLSKLNTIDE